MVTGISTCRAGSSCAGTANEVKTTFAYDSLQRPTSVTIAAGNGSVSSTTGDAYDTKNNMISDDGPLSGAAATITYPYLAPHHPRRETQKGRAQRREKDCK